MAPTSGGVNTAVKPGYIFTVNNGVKNYDRKRLIYTKGSLYLVDDNIRTELQRDVTIVLALANDILLWPKAKLKRMCPLPSVAFPIFIIPILSVIYTLHLSITKLPSTYMFPSQLQLSSKTFILDLKSIFICI